MNETHLCSAVNIVFVALLVTGLFLSLFRLDEILAASPAARKRMRMRILGGADAVGEPILCDPDGRRVPLRSRPKAKFVTPSVEKGKRTTSQQPTAVEA
jgi:hypothetical protein